MSDACRACRGTRAAFSLVEVVLALGIISFCLVALMGLFTTGVQTSRDASDTIQAADIASLLVSARRSAPTNALPATFPLSPLDVPANGTAYLFGNGTAAPGVQQAAYRLTYGISTNGNGLSSLYLMLTWPPMIDPASQPALVKGRYELFTCVPLP